MKIAIAKPLPLQQVLEQLAAWQREPTPARRRRVAAAVGRLVTAYGADGAYVEIAAPPVPELSVGTGELSERPLEGFPVTVAEHPLRAGKGGPVLGRAWVAGSDDSVALAARALEMAVDAAWSRAEARAAGLRLAALDAAVRGIAGVLALDVVLQLIVDRARELVGARYAALGVLGQDGYLERFLTSGISDEERARIGALPRGRGLLGLIIREDRTFRIDDISTDPRRAGFPAHHPPMSSFLGVPVRSKRLSVGNLYLTNKQGASSFSDADQQLVEMFALHAGIAIENARLHEEVGRLAVVEERQRIGQDLHDGIIQSLYAVALSLDDLPEILAEEPAEGSARVDRAIDSIHQTIRDIRNFILGLEPELLGQADLASGLRTLAAEFRLHSMTDLELHVDGTLPLLPPEVAAHLLAITREALSNIARHAAATRAQIELAADDGTLRLVIGDNGRGFDSNAERSEEQRGLTNLRSRAEVLGASLDLRSEAGAGTRIELRVPLPPYGGHAIQ